MFGMKLVQRASDQKVCRIFALILWALVSTAIGTTQARADWVNLSGAEISRNIAEVSVDVTGVTIKLEIFPDDVKVFADIIPDRAFGAALPERDSQAERWARFSLEGLNIKTDDGSDLAMSVRQIEPRTRTDRLGNSANRINPQTGAPLPGPPEDKRVIYAELFYAFQSRPDFIRLTPPKDADGNANATIGFIAFHNKVQVIDFRFLSDTVQLNLDWEDPWYSAFSNPNLTRHHKDALMGFMYVSPRTIRIEALTRLRDLKLWSDEFATVQPVLTVDERAGVLAKAAAFMAAANSVVADGTKLAPVSSWANFVNISNRGVNIIEAQEPMESSTALIGTVSVFNVGQLPDAVVLDWQMFADRQETVKVTLFDPAGPFLSFASRNDNIVEWKNFLKTYSEPAAKPVDAGDFRLYSVPLMSVLMALLSVGLAITALLYQRRRAVLATLCAICIGAAILTSGMRLDVRNPLAGQPGADELATPIQSLLTNLYVAMKEHDSEKKEQALLVSLRKEQLEKVALEAERGLIIQLAGGSQAQSHTVTELVVENIHPGEESGSVSTVVKWKGLISGGHWGHDHRRTVNFEALISLAPVKGNWKIDDMTVTRRN